MSKPKLNLPDTPTVWREIELKILDKLIDGSCISRKRMIEFLVEEYDSQSDGTTLNNILRVLRQKMQKDLPRMVITCEKHGLRAMYQLRRPYIPE